ncbi:MAG TPA: hypothetical protein VFK85_12735 [Anaeromyxobacteraceae bacterium]|nr:hypothetical protein [Anaeromyxobacteraceae bacterium]
MRITTKHAARLAAAGLAVVFGGCATSGSGKSPSAQTIQTPQQQSEQALEAAKKSQERASEQAARAADAQREVQKKQQELQAAQAKARDEQQKAQQLQQEANRQTRQSTTQAQQSQQQASQALSQQTQRVEAGPMTVQGQVSHSTAGQLTLKPSGGDEMTLRVTEGTRVRIDGRQANAADIKPGENALVSYEVSGTEPTAKSIQVVTGSVGATGSGATAPSSTGSTDTSSGTGTSPSTAPQGSGTTR